MLISVYTRGIRDLIPPELFCYDAIVVLGTARTRAAGATLKEFMPTVRPNVALGSV